MPLTLARRVAVWGRGDGVRVLVGQDDHGGDHGEDDGVDHGPMAMVKGGDDGPAQDHPGGDDGGDHDLMGPYEKEI